ncbi:class II aldolase/adducin family protein [Thermanaerothrix sp. 4228-RoL]|uniref:Class II aldolase/adducin family protein n=1 Tax=Thermanaerothrix solaris TaxID=3058434 RepID=A0ABU3NPH3_9CHLR|nr:class II aldolase/adducin family protein [Thermanaerothrix sp. 4228-RoL]MDT8898707.1 class II aldolase/adducin family protein [Thermanaerothrix sp. 4228-RoL]
MVSLPELIAQMGRRLFERRLTDMSGGNISAREGNTLYITPKFSGSRHHWQLSPEDILSGPLDPTYWQQQPLFSREGKAHLAIYETFPEAQAVIHAHPFHVLPFCMMSRPIPPVLENTQKFGIIEVVPPAPAHSQELANNIVAGLRGKEERIRQQAAAVLIPYHGIIVAAKDLWAAIDAVERIDWNAWCILAGKWLD